MLKRFIKSESKLDEQIDKLLEHMSQCEPSTEKYSGMLSDLERLVRLKKDEKLNRVSPDTMAIVAGNLLGILIIVAYEQKHIVTSRGIGFVMRPNSRQIG
jgi:hypothetical protein